jgi:hypothetical protein
MVYEWGDVHGCKLPPFQIAVAGTFLIMSLATDQIPAYAA